MVATTSQSITWLVKQLKRDYPDILFRSGEDDSWSPNQATVYYRLDSSSPDKLLHELGHAILAHISYKRDVELLSMERDAWKKAVDIANNYQLKIDQTVVDDHMDTYRDWLHARSSCPDCETTGLQIDMDLYQCLACDTKWRVNDARTCGLKRYTVTTNNSLS